MLKCIYVKSEDEESLSFISLYEQGVQFYLENNWNDCIYYIENSLNKYRNYYESVTACRTECDFETKDFSNKGSYLYSENIENYKFYELILRRTLCLAKCKLKIMDVLPDNMEYDEYYKDLFKSRKPYEYLHYCYLKVCIQKSYNKHFLVKIFSLKVYRIFLVSFMVIGGPIEFSL